jgi:Protein of unknown function (DUF3363)
MAPAPDRQPDELHALRIGRLRKLEALGLADQIAPGQWVLSEAVETTSRELGERGDIIKRIHHGLAERGLERQESALGRPRHRRATENLPVSVDALKGVLAVGRPAGCQFYAAGSISDGSSFFTLLIFLLTG